LRHLLLLHLLLVELVLQLLHALLHATRILDLVEKILQLPLTVLSDCRLASKGDAGKQN